MLGKLLGIVGAAVFVAAAAVEMTQRLRRNKHRRPETAAEPATGENSSQPHEGDEREGPDQQPQR